MHLGRRPGLPGRRVLPAVLHLHRNCGALLAEQAEGDPEEHSVGDDRAVSGIERNLNDPNVPDQPPEGVDATVSWFWVTIWGVILIDSVFSQRLEQQQDQHAVEPHVCQFVPAVNAHHQLQQSAVRAAVRAGRVEEPEGAVAAR